MENESLGPREVGGCARPDSGAPVSKANALKPMTSRADLIRWAISCSKDNSHDDNFPFQYTQHHAIFISGTTVEDLEWTTASRLVIQYETNPGI
jgi:hypothetical protein